MSDIDYIRFFYKLLIILILIVFCIIVYNYSERPVVDSDYIDTSSSESVLHAPKIDVYIESNDINLIARTMYGECRGVESNIEKAAVVWCILNRVDSDLYGDTIEDVVTHPNQFIGYDPSHPLDDGLVLIAKDVMVKWELEHQGFSDVGRVLPEDYLYFTGDGEHNNFYSDYENKDYWDWSLVNDSLEEVLFSSINVIIIE